jgi:tetratricopeptide (TPR) repeat protein/DNA-binding winged helix-turn-helix (wHTH) protein
MAKPIKHFYQFGSFRLNRAERLLLLDDRPVPLEPKAFDVLVVLLEQSGHLVEKDKLMRQVWPDSFVEEVNLARNISLLRKVLAQGFAEQVCIETVPKHGYRFLPSVSEVCDEQTALVIERTTTASLQIEREEIIQPEETGLAKLAGTILQQWRKIAWRPRPVWLALGGLLVVALVFSFRWGVRQGAPTTQIKTIAVLPFKTLGTQDDNEYLGLGLADALITELGRLRQLVVRPTSAIRRYTDVSQDPIAIGQRQGVEAVLDGNVQRTGDRLRVTAQLIRVADGTILWSGRFDQNFTDIFAVQDSISVQVACDLLTRLCGEAGAAALKQQPINIEAYQAYLKGRYFWNKRTMDGFQKAIEYFKQAIELDPTYARAYAGLGDATYFLGGSDPQTQAESTAKAKAWIKQALALDETLSEAHDSLGLIAMNSDWDWVKAEREYKRAIELDPNYATAHQRYGEFLAYMGRFDEAIAEVKRAQELDPLSLIISTDVAKVYTNARRYDEAIAQYRRALELDPNFEQARGLLALTYAAKGLYEEAEREFHKIEDIANEPGLLAFQGYVYGAAGKRADAQRVLRQLSELAQRTYVAPYWMTWVYAGLGDKDEAFKWFERIFEDRSAFGAITLKVNPAYDNLRSDPRFTDLLRRAGFAP